MNFIEAIKALKDGRRVTNSKLKSAGSCIELRFGYRLITDEGKNLPYAFDSYDFFDDYLDETWELCEKEPKLHTFEEAITAIKNGRIVKRLSNPNDFYGTGKYTGNPSVYRFSEDEILANDWEILPETFPEMHDLKTVIDKYKNGSIIIWPLCITLPIKVKKIQNNPLTTE